MVTVFLAKAMICFASQCYPVLVGERTPLGQFPLTHVMLANRRGKYDVLMFAPDRPGKIFAIHRPPNPHRAALLAAESKTPVTAGCVTVSPAVFSRLIAVDPKDRSTLEIVP